MPVLFRSILIVLIIVGIITIFISIKSHTFPETFIVETLTKMYIPRYPNSSYWEPKIITDSDGLFGPLYTSGVFISFDTEDNAKKVMSFYKDKLTNKGWDVVEEVEPYKGSGPTEYMLNYEIKFRKKFFNLYSFSIKVWGCDLIDPTSKELTPAEINKVDYAKKACKNRQITLGG